MSFDLVDLVLENLPDGWRKLDANEALALVQQLQQEVSAQHKLAAITDVRALARSTTSDDVVYEAVLANERILTQVHLTYGKPSDARFPWSEVFRRASDWRQQAANDR